MASRAPIAHTCPRGFELWRDWKALKDVAMQARRARLMTKSAHVEGQAAQKYKKYLQHVRECDECGK